MVSILFVTHARLFRLARILLIEKEINRRMRGLIKFYDCRRIMQVHTAALSMIHLHLHERLILERAHSLSLSPLLLFSDSYTPGCICIRAIVSPSDENNRCRKSRTAPLSLRDSPGSAAITSSLARI